MGVLLRDPGWNTLKIPRWPPSQVDPYAALKSHHSTGHSLTTDRGLLLAVAELLVPSLNGASSDRFADALELAAIGVLDEADEQWIAPAAAEALESGAAARWNDKLAQLQA